MKSYLISIYIVLHFAIVYSEDTSYVSMKDEPLYEMISNLEKKYFEKKKNMTILLNRYPLKGLFDQKAYDSLHVIVKHILGNYGKVFSCPNEALEHVLQEKSTRYDILFIILEVSYMRLDNTGIPFALPIGTGMMYGMTTGNMYFEMIRFVAIELKTTRIIWDYTLQKNTSWFSSGNRTKINEFTDLGRLCDRVGFGDYGKKGVYKLSTELKKNFCKTSKLRKSQSHRLH